MSEARPRISRASAAIAKSHHEPRQERLSEAQAEALVRWWQDRGYSAAAAPDGCWISAGSSRIRDTGDQLEIHGPVSDDAIKALVTKSREAWGGGDVLTGPWSQADQDRVWLEAQPPGARLDKGPTEIVRDDSQLDRAVTNGISCMGCHNQGIRQATDDIRKHVVADRTFSKDVRTKVEALYPEEAEFKTLLDEDAARFRNAMLRAGLDPELDSQKVGVESINFLSKAYEKAIDLRIAAAEYGLAAEAFAQGLLDAGGATGRVYLVAVGLGLSVGALYWVGVAVVGLVLAYEHSLVSPRDWKRLDTAFFAANGVISIAFFVFVLAEVLV